VISTTVASNLQIMLASPSIDAKRLALLDEEMKHDDYSESCLTDLLIITQRLYGFLPEHVLLHIAKRLRIPSSRVWAVATFYDMFTFESDQENLSFST
jgi:bidirectional [NiFe] hydrogenase diaphorase subunit